jgi:hypothetical protein
LSINWRGIGMGIANALTFGLAGKFAEAFAKMRSSVPAANVGMNSTRGGLAGARAGGGGVNRGRSYLVGEYGPEVFTPGSTGTISTNRRLEAALAGSRGGGPSFTINVNGADDPAAVARQVRVEVERALRRIANGNGALLSD